MIVFFFLSLFARTSSATDSLRVTSNTSDTTWGTTGLFAPVFSFHSVFGFTAELEGGLALRLLGGGIFLRGMVGGAVTISPKPALTGAVIATLRPPINGVFLNIGKRWMFGTEGYDIGIGFGRPKTAMPSGAAFFDVAFFIVGKSFYPRLGIVLII